MNIPPSGGGPASSSYPCSGRLKNITAVTIAKFSDGSRVPVPSTSLGGVRDETHRPFFSHLIFFQTFSGNAVADLVDFETGFVDRDPVTTILTTTNQVSFKVGLGTPTNTAFIAEVGGEVTTGMEPDDGVGTPVEFEAGRFFLTDQATPLDTPPRSRFDFFMTFDNPIFDLSVNLYDFRTDGGAVVGDVATLTAYSGSKLTDPVGSQSFAIPSSPLPDGNVVILRVQAGLEPGESIRSASIIFSSPSGSAFNGHDSGVGIDNIQFRTVPLNNADPCDPPVNSDGDILIDCVDIEPFSRLTAEPEAAPLSTASTQAVSQRIPNTSKGEQTFAFPDVCKTPTPGPVPVPYPSILSFGLRTILSDFGDNTQGPLGNNPIGVAFANSGNLLVLTRNALFEVDRISGVRTLISDLNNFSAGPRIIAPFALAVDAAGDILITESSNLPIGRLYRVDYATGFRTVVSDFNDSSQGPLGLSPRGVDVEASGTILVADSFSSSTGVLFRINPNSGVRTVLSDFGDESQGELGASPWGLALDQKGNVLVTDLGTNMLYEVDRLTGSRTIITNFNDLSKGAVAVQPYALAVQDSGDILVVDTSYGPQFRGAVFLVFKASGFRQILTDFGEAPQGPRGSDPWDVAIDPFGSTYVIDQNGIDALALGTLFEIDIDLATSGTIKSIGGQKLEVTKKPQATKGISVRSEATRPDAAPAKVDFCGQSASVTFTDLDRIFAQCGSVTLEVVSGTVEIDFVSELGDEAGTTLNEANTLTFEPKTSTFTAPPTNPDPVTIVFEGNGITIQPGKTIGLLDSDGDGFRDFEDSCPQSVLDATVVINGCDSGVGNVLFDEGCTISDDIAEFSSNSGNHGNFVSSIAHYTNNLKRQDVITGQQKGAVQSCAAQAGSL